MNRSTGFTKFQHGKHFRPMVDKAWRAHILREQLPESTARDRIAKERWYRAQMHEGCGVYTSKELNPRDGFEQAMAHFEALVNDGSFEWQLRYITGNDRRKKAATRELRESVQGLCREHEIAEDYARGIAKRALKLDLLPSLELLGVRSLLIVRAALQNYIARELKKQTTEVPAFNHD